MPEQLLSDAFTGGVAVIVAENASEQIMYPSRGYYFAVDQPMSVHDDWGARYFL